MSRIYENENISDDQALRATTAQISASRERLAASVGALRDELSSLSDWKEWVRARPLSFVGGALALGIVIGLARGR